MKTKIKLSHNFLLWLSVFIYTASFSWVCIRKFISFGYYDFYLAVHDLSMWNILHGSVFNSILGIPFLGNHMNVILFLIAPLYAIFNHPLFLLILQTLALGLAAVPLFKLAAKILDKNWALLIAIAYLLYPALGYTNLFEFHPTAFATFFLMMAFYLYEAGAFSGFLVFALLAMFCQENIPLAIVMFGILAAFRRRPLKWVIVPIVMGAVYFILALKLISFFNNNTVQFLTIYADWGRTPGEIISNLLARPDLFLQRLSGAHTLRYLYQIFFPVSFLPLAGIYGLLPALPFFLQHILSNRPSELSIQYHYLAEMLPFIFVGFAYGIKLLCKSRWVMLNQRIIKILLLFMICLANLLYGPHWMLPKFISVYKADFLDKQKEGFLAEIPKDASVVATFEFLPRLTHRKNLYSFHHIYSGFYTLSNKKYVLPATVDYALIDFNDFLTFRGFYYPLNYKNNQEFFLNSQWKLQDLEGSIALFKRQEGAKLELCRPIEGLDGETLHKSGFIVEDSIKLLGYNLSNSGKDKKTYELTLYWESLRPTERDINIFVDIVNASDVLVWRVVHPICYRIFPTNSWKANELFKEKIIFTVPAPLGEGGYKIKMGFFEYYNKLLLKINGDTDREERITLGGIK
ncbi:MAG: DUF2079 domain-containing protein [Candidatus Omnitrophica bacterium]|nr:DUF2079 domain-containing protein [Candidatus Omnitrophota bacterium]